MNSNWDKYDIAYVDPNEDYYNGTLFNAYCCAASDVPDWTTSATKVSTCGSTPTIEIASGNVIRAVDGGTIEIKGTKTKWRYGVVPDNANQGCMPEISDSHFVLDNV